MIKKTRPIDHQTEHSSVANEFDPRRAVPRLYITVGPPGAGKSTMSHRLQELGVVWMSRDKIRDWFGDFAFDKEAYVLDTIQAITKGMLLDGRSVVVDANHVKALQRAEPLNWATDLRRRHDLRVETVFLYFPVTKEESILRREKEIKSGKVPLSVIEHQHRSLQVPRPSEGAAVLTVDAHKTDPKDILRINSFPYSALDLRKFP